MKSLAKENTISAKEIKSPIRSHSNNHHVVPVGILIVLCTMYLMAAGLQRNYVYYVKTGVAASNLPPSKKTDVKLESESTCSLLEIFKKDIFKFVSEPHDNLKNSKTFSQGKSLKRNKNLKNGKHLESRKKDRIRKSNTAEPIIYLFALVFIYLLLKAASDINQHYKSQNKGDMRLRRCSLQSYASKQNRRASKVPEDLPLQHRKQTILREVRSISVDRYKYTIAEEEISRPIMPLDRPTNSAVAALSEGGGGDARLQFNRRSSVPISITYQVAHPYPHPHPAETLVKRGSVISLSNLPSLPGADTNSTFPDSFKRRVRMINRH